MAAQPTPPASKSYTILLIVPFAALAAFLAIYGSPAVPEQTGSIFWQIFLYGVIAALITGIWAGVSHSPWSGWRFAGTFAALLIVGIAMLSVGRMNSAEATDPASKKTDPWIVLTQ